MICIHFNCLNLLIPDPVFDGHLWSVQRYWMNQIKNCLARIWLWQLAQLHQVNYSRHFIFDPSGEKEPNWNFRVNFILRNDDSHCDKIHFISQAWRISLQGLMIVIATGFIISITAEWWWLFFWWCLCWKYANWMEKKNTGEIWRRL